MKVVNSQRRFFLSNVVKFLPFVGVGTFSYPLLKFTMFQEAEKVILSVPLQELHEKITKIEKFFIYKNESSIKVYDAHCTHMGCILNFIEKTQIFTCPCHSSEFALDGTKLKGPATRNLDIIKSRIENNILHIG